MTNEIRSGNTEAANTLATQLIRDDRYYMPAWAVMVDSLAKLGQGDRVRTLLVNLAEDPALPAEDKADLIRLLTENGAASEGAKLLATLPANDNETIRLRASVAAASGDTSTARTLMAQALTADPTNTGLRLQFVDLLMQADRGADARAQLDQLTGSKLPLTASESLTAAKDYLALRLPNEAEAIAKQLLAGQPQNVEALGVNAQAEKMLAGGAGTTTASSPEVRPDQASISDTLRLASAALEKKDFASALSLARGGLVKDSVNPRLHEAAARALAGLTQYDQAVDEIAAAAGSQPDSREAFAVFVDLFPDADSAAKGLGYAGRLLSINPALSDWSMGRLAEKTGQADLALRYYADGITAANRLTDPTAAKESLYGAVLAVDALKKDTAAIKKAADQFAKDGNYAMGVRLAAAGHLLEVGDRAAAEEQLTILSDSLSTTGVAPRITLAVAQNWMALGQPDRARALIEKQISAGNRDPQLLAADASLVQQSDPSRALAIVQQLSQQDSTNPQYKVALAEMQAATGDDAAAFRTLDDARSLGETGRQLATTARLRILISTGLLKEAADELAAHPSPTKDDFPSMLAIGQAWAEVHDPASARKILIAIPSYAAENTAARIALANLDLEAGDAAAAVAGLKAITPASPDDASQVAGALFHAYIRAGDPGAALDLAKAQRNQTTPGTAAYRAATLYAVAAAREGRRFDDAVNLLLSLDGDSQKASAPDLALLNLLRNKPADAAAIADSIPDIAPAYSRSTLKLLGGTPASDTSALLSRGSPAAVYAALSTFSADKQKSAMKQIAENPHVFAGDVARLLDELGTAPDSAGGALRTGSCATTARIRLDDDRD